MADETKLRKEIRDLKGVIDAHKRAKHRGTVRALSKRLAMLESRQREKRLDS